MISLHGGPGFGDRQFEMGMAGAELPFPVRKLFFQHFIFQPVALPGCKIGVLQFVIRQPYVKTFCISGIELGYFADKDPHRPGVGHNMMHGQKQNIFLGIEPEYCRPE